MITDTTLFHRGKKLRSGIFYKNDDREVSTPTMKISIFFVESFGGRFVAFGS